MLRQHAWPKAQAFWPHLQTPFTHFSSGSQAGEHIARPGGQNPGAHSHLPCSQYVPGWHLFRQAPQWL